MIYAGIGSRKTPKHIQEKMRDKAEQLASSGWTLRSGGASGADTAFEVGCTRVKGKSEIFFTHHYYVDGHEMKDYDKKIFNEAYAIAKEYHPAWHRLSPHAELLMTRNVFQILGVDLMTPSMYVLCWTADGKASGGTGQALRIAMDYNIKIINFHEG